MALAEDDVDGVGDGVDVTETGDGSAELDRVDPAFCFFVGTAARAEADALGVAPVLGVGAGVGEVEAAPDPEVGVARAVAVGLGFGPGGGFGFGAAAAAGGCVEGAEPLPKRQPSTEPGAGLEDVAPTLL